VFSNIFGVRGREVDFIRRKSYMKAKFREAGVPVARGQIVHTVDDAHSLINETGYPVIAKPDDGVGAIATYRLNGDQDLATFFETKPDNDYIMEEFISGSIYSKSKTWSSGPGQR
jgi:biotin carboxylase